MSSESRIVWAILKAASLKGGKIGDFMDSFSFCFEPPAYLTSFLRLYAAAVSEDCIVTLVKPLNFALFNPKSFFSEAKTFSMAADLSFMVSFAE